MTFLSRKKISAFALMIAMSLVSTLALAEPGAGSFDISEATSTLSSVTAAIGTIGGVMIGLAALAVGFKWIKGMIFG